MQYEKIFILSDDALASRSDSLLRFGQDNMIVITGVNINGLSKVSQQYDEKGRNAKKILKYIESLDYSALSSDEGVRQSNGSILRVERGFREVEVIADELTYVDKRIFQIALGLKKKYPGKPIILINENPGFRLNAKHLGLDAQDYKDEVFPSLTEQYKGRCSVATTKNNLKTFLTKGKMSVKEIFNYTEIELFPNLFLEITAADSVGYSAIGRYDGAEIVKLNYGNDYHPFKIIPKNNGQKMLIESMMTDCEKAPLVIAKGGAGTGKTYQTLACALEQVLETGMYQQVMISTSTATVGNEEIGFLPGEIENKFAPHIGGLRDNLRILLNANKKKKSQKESQEDKFIEEGQYFFEKGVIQMEPIGFLRGRTIVDTFCIIDETQNISPDDIKSIVSRAGEGSKFVFLGDPTQIDNPKLNENYNGLVFLSEKMKGYSGAWQVTLNEEESVRSELAKLAAKIL